MEQHFDNILSIYPCGSQHSLITIMEKKHESIDKGDAFRSLLTDLYIVSVFNTSYWLLNFMYMVLIWNL